MPQSSYLLTACFSSFGRASFMLSCTRRGPLFFSSASASLFFDTVQFASISATSSFLSEPNLELLLSELNFVFIVNMYRLICDASTAKMSARRQEFLYVATYVQLHVHSNVRAATFQAFLQLKDHRIFRIQQFCNTDSSSHNR